MNLLIAFIHREDTAAVLKKLQEMPVPTTVLESRGGFLPQANQTLLLAVEDSQTDEVLTLFRAACTRRTAQVDTMFAGGMIENIGLPAVTNVEIGGATILILAVTRAVKI